jgi:hypothetical protein
MKAILQFNITHVDNVYWGMTHFFFDLFLGGSVWPVDCLSTSSSRSPTVTKWYLIRKAPQPFCTQLMRISFETPISCKSKQWQSIESAALFFSKSSANSEYAP